MVFHSQVGILAEFETWMSVFLILSKPMKGPKTKCCAMVEIINKESLRSSWKIQIGKKEPTWLPNCFAQKENCHLILFSIHVFKFSLYSLLVKGK